MSNDYGVDADAGQGDGVSPSGDGAGIGSTVWSLRLETARIRNLSAECREAGVDYAGLPVELRDIRDLVEERRFDEALARMRELKLELLGRLLLAEPGPLPPSVLENVQGSVTPSEVVLEAVNRGPSSGIPPRPKPGAQR